MRVGIDATNIGGGGCITHLKEMLYNFDDQKYKNEVTTIIVFASQKVLDCIDDLKNVKKMTFPELNGNILSRIFFQFTKFDKIIEEECDVLLSATGDYLGSFKPFVGMSRNMLLYERDIWKEIGQIKEVGRFWLSFQRQKRTFKKSQGIIFISQYAKEYIVNKLKLEGKELKTIHHGVSLKFKNEPIKHKHINSFTNDNPFVLLYVSTVHVYKHQWNVIQAVSLLREKGYPIKLQLVGSVIFKPSGTKLFQSIEKFDPKREFIDFKGHISYEEIDRIYKNANGLIFASTCENMPNILLECMSSGVAIACSNKQPMPEFLKQNGYYFDSYDLKSLCLAIESLLLNPKQNDTFAELNYNEVDKYSWKETSNLTFDFLIEVYKKYKGCVE